MTGSKKILRIVLGGGIVLFCGLSAPNSFAKRDEHGRTSVQVEPEKKKAKVAKVKSARDGRPDITRDEIFAVEVERKLIQGIDTTIKYLRKTADSMPKKSPERLDVLDRLLNLYLEQALYIRNEEYRKYDEIWQKWDDGGRKGREPKLAVNQSMTLWNNVANEAQSMLAEYPRSKTADITTFTYALALQFLNKEQQAAKVFTQIIQKYPNSQKAGDAYFSLGDFYFDRNEFRSAMNNYRQALKFNRAKTYGWSLYKLGWCEYNLGNFRAALDNWKRTVIVAKTQPSQLASRLKEEAMREMVFAFAELKDIDGAINYYRANGGDQFIAQFLNLLAETFGDQGRYAEAIRVLKRFQALDPYSPAGPETQKQIVSLASDINNKKLLWEELERFGKLYGPKSPWADKNEKDRKLVLETQQLIKDQILYYAKLVHKNAQKDDNLAGYAEAEKGYNLFLQSYPGAKESAEAKYNLADIEYWLKHYRNAGRLYLELASMEKDKAAIFDTKTGKATNVHQQSARYMVLSYKRDFEDQYKVMVKQEPDFKKPPKPLTVQATNFIKGCATYRKLYPNDIEYARDCDVYVADVYFFSNNRKESMQYLWIVATKYPKSPEGPKAVNRLIPMYKEDKETLLKTVDKLLAIDEYKKGELGKKLNALKRGAEVDAIAQEKDSFKRAQMYEAQAQKKDANKGDVDKFWYNAAVDYLKAGAIPQSIRAYMVIVKDYPKSPQVQESMLQVAKLHERRLELVAAASFFHSYVTRYPKDKNTAAVSTRACELAIAMDSENALSYCTASATRDPESAKGLYERLIAAADRANRNTQLVSLIKKDYLPRFKLSPDQRIIAQHRVYKAYNSRGPEAQVAASDIMGTFRSSRGSVTGEGLRYVGEIAFNTANVEMPKYLNVKLVGGTVDRLAASIEAKGKALAQIRTSYDQVLAVKDAYWGVAALHQLGFAYENFGRMLENPPAIQGAKPEDVKKQLEPQVKQILGEAKNWYNAAQDSVAKFSAYSEWSAKVVTAQARLAGSKVSFLDWIVTPDFLPADVPESAASILVTNR